MAPSLADSKAKPTPPGLCFSRCRNALCLPSSRSPTRFPQSLQISPPKSTRTEESPEYQPSRSYSSTPSTSSTGSVKGGRIVDVFMPGMNGGYIPQGIVGSPAHPGQPRGFYCYWDPDIQSAQWVYLP